MFDCITRHRLENYFNMETRDYEEKTATVITSILERLKFDPGTGRTEMNVDDNCQTTAGKLGLVSMFDGVTPATSVEVRMFLPSDNSQKILCKFNGSSKLLALPSEDPKTELVARPVGCLPKLVSRDPKITEIPNEENYILFRGPFLLIQRYREENTLKVFFKLDETIIPLVRNHWHLKIIDDYRKSLKGTALQKQNLDLKCLGIFLKDEIWPPLAIHLSQISVGERFGDSLLKLLENISNGFEDAIEASPQEEKMRLLQSLYLSDQPAELSSLDLRLITSRHALQGLAVCLESVDVYNPVPDILVSTALWVKKDFIFARNHQLLNDSEMANLASKIDEAKDYYPKLIHFITSQTDEIPLTMKALKTVLLFLSNLSEVQVKGLTTILSKLDNLNDSLSAIKLALPEGGLEDVKKYLSSNGKNENLMKLFLKTLEKVLEVAGIRGNKSCFGGWYHRKMLGSVEHRATKDAIKLCSKVF